MRNSGLMVVIALALAMSGCDADWIEDDAIEDDSLNDSEGLGETSQEIASGYCVAEAQPPVYYGSFVGVGHFSSYYSPVYCDFMVGIDVLDNGVWRRMATQSRTIGPGYSFLALNASTPCWPGYRARYRSIACARSGSAPGPSCEYSASVILTCG